MMIVYSTCTDISRGCIAIYNAVISFETLKVILTSAQSVQHAFRWGLNKVTKYIGTQCIMVYIFSKVNTKKRTQNITYFVWFTINIHKLFKTQFVHKTCVQKEHKFGLTGRMVHKQVKLIVNTAHQSMFIGNHCQI